jgi:hypothetical protein
MGSGTNTGPNSSPNPNPAFGIGCFTYSLFEAGRAADS